jgi:CRISPR-associated endonuclease/helicase Cas3
VLAGGDALTPDLDWLQPISAGLLRDFKILPHPTGGLLLTGRRRLNLQTVEVDGFCDEDDPTASGNTRSLLDEHLDGVAAFAAAFARGCGLAGEAGAAVESAAGQHDVGKADPRFQTWLKGGNPWLRGPLLAKSETMAQGRQESEAARIRAGYPAGGRHELLSVRLLESEPEALPATETARDLLLHLVASHHGHCRPFAPVVDDARPVDVTLEFQGLRLSANSATALERLDSGVAERFWRLTRRYGWWGLAWLEAIVRLADHRRSEAEEHG